MSLGEMCRCISVETTPGSKFVPSQGRCKFNLIENCNQFPKVIIPLPPLQTVSKNSSCSKSSQHRYSCLYFQHFPCPCLDASFLPRSHFSVCAWALPAPEYSLRLGETLSFMGIFVLLRSSSSYTHPLDIKKKKSVLTTPLMPSSPGKENKFPAF